MLDHFVLLQSFPLMRLCWEKNSSRFFSKFRLNFESCSIVVEAQTSPTMMLVAKTLTGLMDFGLKSH